MNDLIERLRATLNDARTAVKKGDLGTAEDRIVDANGLSWDILDEYVAVLRRKAILKGK